MVTCSIGFFSCSGEKSWETAEDVKETTWQSTNAGQTGWIKLVLNKDNTFVGWTASPAQGHWDDNNKKTGRYEVKTQRSSDDGRNMLIVSLDKHLYDMQYLVIYKKQVGYRNNEPWIMTKAAFTNFPDAPTSRVVNFVTADLTDKNPWD